MTDTPQFRVVLRGYEPAQVDQSMQQLAAQAEEARAHAEQLAERVRVLEQQSREAAVLSKRRDEIAAELEGLSGVIQALAVPTDGPTDLPPDMPSEGPARSAPEEKEAP